MKKKKSKKVKESPEAKEIREAVAAADAVHAKKTPPPHYLLHQLMFLWKRGKITDDEFDVASTDVTQAAEVYYAGLYRS